jgi:hypothetical protein
VTGSDLPVVPDDPASTDLRDKDADIEMAEGSNTISSGTGPELAVQVLDETVNDEPERADPDMPYVVEEEKDNVSQPQEDDDDKSESDEEFGGDQ